MIRCRPARVPHTTRRCMVPLGSIRSQISSSSYHPDSLKGLAGQEPSRFRRAGPRREPSVEAVDVE
jgi:hypothetical protein